MPYRHTAVKRTSERTQDSSKDPHGTHIPFFREDARLVCQAPDPTIPAARKSDEAQLR